MLRILVGGIVGAAVGLACGLGHRGGWPTIPFICDPAGPEQPPCPEGFGCCSDDPASIQGVLLFANASNSRSRHGMCIDPNHIPGVQPRAAPGCVTACNPTWERERIEEVCGTFEVCCQTVELVEEDCVLDEDDGRWRPMDGRDAAAAAASGAARWGDGTHQDPDFSSCEAYAGGRDKDAFFACAGQLTVADQRGFCIALSQGQACPVEQPEYVDACEALNE